MLIDKEWKDRMLAVTILYLMLEKGKKFSTLLEGDEAFAEQTFDRAFAHYLLKIEKGSYIVEPKGKDVLVNVIKSIDVIRQFDAFATVNVDRHLTQEEQLSPSEPFTMRKDSYDPRFDPGDPGAIDLRLALITWLGDVASNRNILPMPIDPHEVVYLQRLGTGQITNQPDFWSGLAAGDIFSDIEKVVSSAYRWTDMDPSSPEDANRCMEALYSAGMVEIRKRQGTQCGECGTPLAILEEEARKNGVSLDTCPNCGRSFNPPPVVGQAGTLSCPRCKTILFDDDRICNGCGVLIDYSLPMGTIETETIVEPVFTGSYYGYTSYGWLYPYDPYYDLAIYGCLAYAFW